MQKKLGSLLGIIFFLINFAFAEDIDCTTLNKYPCDKIGEVDFEKVSQKCNQSGITALSQRLDECKKTYLEEKEATQSQLENIQTEESKTKATLSRLDSALAEINFEIAELNLNIESLE